MRQQHAVPADERNRPAAPLTRGWQRQPSTSQAPSGVPPASRLISLACSPTPRHRRPTCVLWKKGIRDNKASGPGRSGHVPAQASRPCAVEAAWAGSQEATLRRIIVATLGTLGLILPAGFAVAFVLFRNDLSKARPGSPAFQPSSTRRGMATWSTGWPA